MDEVAEQGFAAHWKYKDGVEEEYTEDENELNDWLHTIKEILDDPQPDAMDFLDTIKLNLFASEIFVFTPKGEQRTIQAGATALDFAYAIHSHIGNSAIAAKVNMRLAPLSQVLRSGDQVEIITAQSGRPKLEWLQFLQTRHARNVVLDWFKSDREALVRNGESIYNERLSALGQPNTVETLKQMLVYVQLNEKSELFFRIGVGLIGPEDFRKALGKNVSAVQIRNGRYLVAECCNPIPGDPLIGFKASDGTIIVHKKSCPLAESMASKHGDLVVTVPDIELEAEEFTVRISLKGIDRVGLLNDITQKVSVGMGLNMTNLQLGSRDGIFDGFIEMKVRDRQELDSMIASLRSIEGISDVLRTDI